MTSKEENNFFDKNEIDRRDQSKITERYENSVKLQESKENEIEEKNNIKNLENELKFEKEKVKNLENELRFEKEKVKNLENYLKEDNHKKNKEVEIIPSVTEINKMSEKEIVNLDNATLKTFTNTMKFDKNLYCEKTAYNFLYIEENDLDLNCLVFSKDKSFIVMDTENNSKIWESLEDIEYKHSFKFFSKFRKGDKLYICASLMYHFKVFIYEYYQGQFNVFKRFYDLDYEENGFTIYSTIIPKNNDLTLVVNLNNSKNDLLAIDLLTENRENIKNDSLTVHYHVYENEKLITLNTANICTYNPSKNFTQEKKFKVNDETIKFIFAKYHKGVLYATSNKGLRAFDWKTCQELITLSNSNFKEWSLCIWNDDYLISNQDESKNLFIYDIKDQKEIKLHKTSSLKNDVVSYWIEKSNETINTPPSLFSLDPRKKEIIRLSKDELFGN